MCCGFDADGLPLAFHIGEAIPTAEAGAVGVVGSILPFIMTVMLYGLKALVAFLQAYVFAILTSIYLHDAVHLH